MIILVIGDGLSADVLHNEVSAVHYVTTETEQYTLSSQAIFLQLNAVPRYEVIGVAHRKAVAIAETQVFICKQQSFAKCIPVR